MTLERRFGRDHAGGAAAVGHAAGIPGKRTLTHDLVAAYEAPDGQQARPAVMASAPAPGTSSRRVDRLFAIPSVAARSSGTADGGAALQRSAATAGPATAPAIVDQVISGGGGAALDSATRARMEGRFGQDFRSVRVHTGDAAAAAARSVSAHAFTVGNNIVFGEGQYDPGSARGQHLLAHELTHVVQQGGSRAMDGALHRSSSGEEGGQRGVAARMEALAVRLESLCASVAPPLAKPPDDAPPELAAVRAAVPDLRALARSGDEAACEEVLRLFAEKLGDAGLTRAMPPPHAQGTGAPAIHEQAPQALAKRALHVSAPDDAAEREAEAVADAVVGDGTVTVRETGAEGVHREGYETLVTGLIILGVTGAVVLVGWLLTRGSKEDPAFPAEERRPILSAIRDAEQRAGLSNDDARRARAYLDTLSEKDLRRVGEALRAVDREAKDDDEDEDNVDRDAKLIIAKARLLMLLVDRITTVADIAAAERGEDPADDSDGNLGFDVEGELQDSHSFVEAPHFDTNAASQQLSKQIARREIERWVAELADEIDAAERLCNGLREAIRAHVELLIGVDRYEVLRAVGTVLRNLTTCFDRVVAEPQRDDAEKQEKLRIARVRLLIDLFLNRAPVLDVGRHALQLAKADLSQLAGEVANDDVSPQAMQDGNDAELRAAKQRTQAQHLEERRILLEILDAGLRSDSPLLKNSCEWLHQSRKVYVVTPTHDSLGRARKAGQFGMVAHFPNTKKSDATVFDRPTDYDNSLDNITFRSSATKGTNDSGGDGSIAFYKLTTTPREDVERTIIHEVQHGADLHGRDAKARYQSEINAHMIGNQHGKGYEFLNDKNPGRPVDQRDQRWDELAFGVFEHMYADSGSYEYLRTGWDDDEPGFRDDIAAIEGPHTPNPVNSIRIKALLDAVQAIDPSDVEDDDLVPNKKRQIKEALDALDKNDERALNGNRALKKVFERLPKQARQMLGERFKV